MSSPAVEFESVSKRYVIRHQKTGYLKDRLTNFVRRFNPFARRQADETVEDFWALKDVSFRIQPGESVGIIGPNGSGKSTTLKILAGVTKQTSGRVAVNGRLGALIEVGAGFHPELSGRENVFLNGSILGMKKADIAKKFDSIVAFAEVEQFIDTPVKHYSSGMYVRLGFAIAVHNDPEILLIDEVLAVGDLAFQRKCFDKMKELKASGRTIVLISHSMGQIETLCERAILLRKGQLVADGRPRDVAQKYVELADGRSELSEQGGADSGIAITSVRLLDENGNPTTRAELGKPMAFDIEFDARRPVSDVLFAVHVDRGQQRVYDSDTRSLGINLGTLSGKGIAALRDPQSLAHAQFLRGPSRDLQRRRAVFIAREVSAHVLHLCSPGSPQDRLRAWTMSRVRGIVFGPCELAKTRSSVIDAGTYPAGQLGGATTSDIGCHLQQSCG